MKNNKKRCRTGFGAETSGAETSKAELVTVPKRPDTALPTLLIILLILTLASKYFYPYFNKTLMTVVFLVSLS